jgi:hypothetical protein
MCEGEIETCNICLKIILYEKSFFIPSDDSKPTEITYERQDHPRCEVLERKRKKALDILKKIEEDIEEERWISEQ